MATNNFEMMFVNMAMDGFSEILAPISAFSFTLQQNDANFGDTVKCPVMLHSSASLPFSYASGYSTDVTDIKVKDVPLNILMHRTAKIEDNAASKLTAENFTQMFEGMGRALARDMISASFSAVLTEANFPTSASATQNELTSSIGLSDLVLQADTLNWTPNRSMILAPSAFQYLLNNPDVNQSYAFGSSDPVQQANIQNVYGFSVHKYTGALPVVDQPAKGIVCDRGGILFGMGFHTPAESSKGLVQVYRAQSSQTAGLAIQMRTFYDTLHATTYYVCEALAGVAVGLPTGGQRRLKVTGDDYQFFGGLG